MEDANPWVAAPRSELEFRGHWGLYSNTDQRWLDLLFSSERDANDAVKALSLERKARQLPPPI